MIEEANREIWAAVTGELRRRAEWARLRVMIQRIDDLLWELEDLNLRDVRSVPPRLWDQVAEVVAAVHNADPRQIPVRRRISNALDVLFASQAVLIGRRSEMLGLVAQEDWQEDLEEELAESTWESASVDRPRLQRMG